MSASALPESSAPTQPQTPNVPQPTPHRPVRVHAPEPRQVTCFSIRAAAEPGVMPRVLEVFAKRSLVPQRWYSDLVGPPGREELSIDLQVADVPPELGAYMARCLRQIWGVETVLTSEKGYA